MHPRSLTRMTVALFTAGTLLIAAVFTILVVTLVNLQNDYSAARSSSGSLTQSFAVEHSVLDLDSALREFALGGHPELQQTYLHARNSLPGQIAGLRTLANTRAEQGEVDLISASIREYLDQYAAPLVSAVTNHDRNAEVQLAARGRQLLDELRARFDSFNTGQLALRRRWHLNARDRSTPAIVLAAAGFVIFLILLLAQRIYLVTRILRPIRVVANAAGRLARGDLAARVPRVGSGEIALLGHAFNEMAGTIQARESELGAARSRLEEAANQAQEASALKSRFLANMSHEIRTPLNGLVGMTNLLAETELNEEQREYVDAAQASADVLLTVVNDVLDIGKIEAGRIELEHREFDLPEMVEATCSLMASSARSKGLELRPMIHGDVPGIVRGDRTRVSQILTNLISNAVKFTGRGDVAIEVRLAGRNDDTADVAFEVRDTGIGIAAEDIDRLFEAFVQAEAGTTRQFGGTGLGLAICQQLTRMMGGTISVESDPGVGSAFTFTIPLELVGAEPAGTRPAGDGPGRATDETTRSGLPGALVRLPTHPGWRPGSRILVAEDQPVNWMLMARMLAKRGLIAVNAPDGRRAVEMLSEDRYDLVLMDCHMPVLDGYGSARVIRDREQARGGPRIPILGITASATVADRDRCLAAGMDDYLTKPVSATALDSALSRWLPPAETPVLDETRLAELAALFSSQELADMRANLSSEVEGQLERMTVAISRGDVTALAEAAHRITNSGRMIGADELTDAAIELEQLARTAESCESTDVAQAARALCARWEQAQAAIDLEFGRLMTGSTTALPALPI